MGNAEDFMTISSLEDARDVLREWREKNGRQSEEVVEIWDEVLKDDMECLGDERWMVYEQVAVAALDCHRGDILDRCLKALKNEFALDSFRVRRLYAMRFELAEDWDNAIKILDLILEEDDSNNQAKKRKIAILKAQGENQKAITELTKYLKDYMSDQESWTELCDLYIQEQDYGKAAFCCEELILHNPHNHIYYQRYAEIRYTQGGFEHLELAKTYYSHAIKLNPQNMRALYGLLLTSTQLASSPKCTAQKKKEYLKTVVWTGKQISKTYEMKLSGEAPTGLLEGLMGQLQIST